MVADHAGGGTRFHDMDALRAAALLLGIVLHGAMPFAAVGFWPAQEEYAYTVDPEGNPYNYAVMAIHGFRMPVFFVVAGFFTAMLWQSRGLRSMVRHRLRRIGLPLLVGAFTVVPAVIWLFAGDGFEIAYWPTAWLWGGFAHLWFLWYLLLAVGVLAATARLGLNFCSRLWWLLVPAAILPQYAMQGGVFGADTPLEVLPPPHLLAYYVIFFAFGAFFYRSGMAARRRWTLLALPALVLVLPAGLAVQYGGPLSGIEGARELGAVLQVAYAWLMCFGLMGLFCMVASKERRRVRYLSDSSYWVYICHLPLMIALQVAVLDWAVDAHVKFALVCITTVAVLLAAYRYCVRYTPVGRALNGPRP